MREFIPVVIAILAMLVVISAIYLRRSLSLRQVVKPVEDMDMVERIKVSLTTTHVKKLTMRLESAAEEAERSGKPVNLDLPDTNDRIIRFIVSPSK
jgi:hypothetical protein